MGKGGCKNNGRKMPRSVQVVVGCWKISIQLWWEVLPWVQLMVSGAGRRELEVREGVVCHLASSKMCHA